MNSNSDNPKIGKTFQMKVLQWFENNHNGSFDLEQPILIGDPARPHKFDIADKTQHIVIECKCYTWTDSGNIPSAKLRGLNEAVFYFSFLPAETEKLLVMAYATHSRRSETLAEYYFRTNHHLLGDVKVVEFNVETNEMRTIGGCYD